MSSSNSNPEQRCEHDHVWHGSECVRCGTDYHFGRFVNCPGPSVAVEPGKPRTPCGLTVGHPPHEFIAGSGLRRDCNGYPPSPAGVAVEPELAEERPSAASDRVTAERDALQAEVSTMTTYRDEWQRRAQRAEQDRNDEHDQVAALQARIEVARALHVRGAHATSDHFHCDPHECDRAGEGEIVPFCDTCDEAWPCATVRALAAVGVDQTTPTESAGSVGGTQE